MINFAVTHTCGSYWKTKHVYKIGFLATMRVRSCEDLPIKLTGFSPANFQELIDDSLNTDYLVGKYFYNRVSLHILYLKLRLLNPLYIYSMCFVVVMSLGRLWKLVMWSSWLFSSFVNRNEEKVFCFRLVTNGFVVFVWLSLS